MNFDLVTIPSPFHRVFQTCVVDCGLLHAASTESRKKNEFLAERGVVLCFCCFADSLVLARGRADSQKTGEQEGMWRVAMKSGDVK